MNILHISTADLRHGAGKAAYRLHCGLRKQGIRSSMLVAEKTSDDPDVVSLNSSHDSLFPVGRFIKDVIELGINTCWVQGSFSFFTKSLWNHPLVVQADVIHCHNLHWPFKNFPLKFLNIGHTKPLLWTLHDMWPLTGHCYHSFECTKWRNGCGKGCRLSTFMPIVWNSSNKQWRFKKELYNQTPFHVVTPSQWMTNMAKESPLFKGHTVTCIPNMVDTLVFSMNSDKKILRHAYGFSEQEKIVFFTAANINVPLKGLNLLLDVLASQGKKITLVIAGRGKVSLLHHKTLKIRHFGNIKDEHKMSELYNLADITVVPSKAESFGNIVIESMSCGIPVVAFKVGGIPDMIDHKVNGYLAEVEDKVSLAKGIEYFLDNDQVRFVAGKAAREKVLEFFCEKKVVASHRMFYEHVLEVRKNI